MKSMVTVMGYTFREAVQKKSFLISNLIIAAIILVLFNIPNLMLTFSDNSAQPPIESVGEGTAGGAVGATVVFVSRQDLVSDADLATYPNSQVGDIAALDALKERVSAGDLSGLVAVSREGDRISYDYYWSGRDESKDITRFLTDLQSQALLERAGVDSGTATAIRSGAVLSAATDLTREGEGGFMSLQAILPMMASYILFFIIYFYGYRVSGSISTEKTSRVMETLITSTSPTAIVLGKTFANGLLALLQLLLLIAVCAVGYLVFLPSDFRVLGLLMGEGGIGAMDVLVILVYFVLGYLVYAMLNAVTGATVSKAEDISTANMPVTIVTMIAFFASYFTSMAPGSAANTVVSLIPFTSPFTMPGRILAGGVPGWQIGLSIVILLVTVAFIAYLSIRIYSALILHYGNRLKLKDLFLAYKNQ